MRHIVALCIFCLGGIATAQAEPKDTGDIREDRSVLDLRSSAVESGQKILLSSSAGGANSSNNSENALDGKVAEKLAGAEKRASSSGNTDWLGFWENAYDFADVEAWLGRPIRVAHFMLAFGKGGFRQGLAQDQKRWLSDFSKLVPHAQLALLLDIFPRADQNPRFAEVAAGDWDEELRQVARRIIDTGHEDAIIRLWHEPEVAVKNRAPIGPTWCDDPAFLPAWRHVHDLFNAEEGANFIWQYSVNGPAGRQARAEDGTLWIEKCYPGKDYVDQVSVGAYHRMGPTEDISWQISVSKLEFGRDWAFKRGHKFSVAEWGLWSSECRWEGQDDDPNFIRQSHDFFAAIPEAKRGYMLYFNSMDCVDIARYPESEAMFEKLFGG